MREETFDVAGLRALITGGARGLGRAISELLASKGARVVIADILEQEGRDVAENLDGGGHHFVKLNIANEKDVQNAIEFGASQFGGFDIVVNSAGIAKFEPATELSVEDFAQTMAINVTGAFCLSKYAGIHMIAERIPGRIIHLGSASSIVSNSNYAAYASSKAALAHLVRVFAREWAIHSITVNALGPAFTPTALTGPTMENETLKARRLAEIPMSRFGTPEDLFGAVLLLASTAGRFITGQTLFVDGGRTLV
jgi:NAD(P)-dependent dehydrogenase (short-subunit alcohol dehydrogenase family)